MDLGKGFFKNKDVDGTSSDITKLANRDYQRDTALLDSKQDKFKHTHYVKVLEDILLKSEPPINIGLYGRWGVGKSSILNMLKSEIESTLSKDFRYLYVDAWGLTGSTLQQEVLININSQLKKYKESDLEDLLFNVREEKIVSLEKAFQRSWPLAILVVGIVIGYRFFSDQLINLIAVIGLSTGVAVVSSVMKYALGTSKRILSGAVSSYQFGAIYDKIVKKESKKLVVVIDNLDRCDDKVAVDLLGLIQTFMTRKNCINILACDDEAIVNHLQAVKGEAYTEKEGNEFLSKFFQVTIRIPPFIGENLDGYVSELISQRSIKFDPFVKQILISGAIKNPRKANQFLNNVVALYRLAELKEKDKRIPQDSITKHTDFLTKMIVLRHEWPKFYKYMEKNPSILDEVNSVFSGKLKEAQLPQTILTMFYDEEEEGLKDFLSATQYCTVRDIKPFLRLNQESYEGEIPEIEKFELDVSNGRLDVVTETLRNSNDKLKLDYVKKMISINDRHAKEGATAALLISNRVLIGALDVVDDQSIKQIALENLGRNLTSTLKEHLEKYDMNRLFPLISEMKSYYQDQLYRIMLDLINLENKLNPEMIKKLLENNLYISSNALTELDQKLTLLISENETEILNIIKEVCVNPSWINNKFVKPAQFIITFISKILFDNSPPDNERLDIYLSIQNNLDLSEKKLFVKQIKINVDRLSNTSSNLPNNLLEIIDNISKTMIHDLGSYVNDFFASLSNATTKIPDLNQKKSLLEVLFRVIKESDKINPELIVKFEEALAIYLESGNVEVLNWFVNMDNSYKSNLLHSPEIIKKLWNSSVRTGLNNSSVIQYLAMTCPKENYEFLVELFSTLIKTKDPNQYSTLLEIFIQNHNVWVNEISNKILEEFIKTALEMGMPNGTKLLDQILGSLPNLSENYLQLISAEASSWINSNDPNARNWAIQLLKSVNQKYQRKMLVASQNVLDQINILLSGNDLTVRNLVEYIVSSPKELTAKQENQLIEIITTNLTSNKPIPILELLLEFAPKLIETLNRYQLLYGIVELSKTVSDENIRNRCFVIIRSNKGLLTTKDENKIKEFFGDDFFKKDNP